MLSHAHTQIPILYIAVSSTAGPSHCSVPYSDLTVASVYQIHSAVVVHEVWIS